MLRLATLSMLVFVTAAASQALAQSATGAVDGTSTATGGMPDATGGLASPNQTNTPSGGYPATGQAMPAGPNGQVPATLPYFVGPNNYLVRPSGVELPGGGMAHPPAAPKPVRTPYGYRGEVGNYGVNNPYYGNLPYYYYDTGRMGNQGGWSNTGGYPERTMFRGGRGLFNNGSSQGITPSIQPPRPMPGRR